MKKGIIDEKMAKF